MLRPSESLFSWTNSLTAVSATARFSVAATSSWRSPLSMVDTSASDWLNWRTVWSLSARVSMKPPSASTEPNSSSLLSASVALSWQKSLIVWWKLVALAAEVVGRDREQVGEGAVTCWRLGAERDVEAVEALVDLVELERLRGLLDRELRAVGERLARRCRPG